MVELKHDVRANRGEHGRKRHKDQNKPLIDLKFNIYML